MKLRNVASLYLVRLRGRIGQELLALVGNRRRRRAAVRCAGREHQPHGLVRATHRIASSATPAFSSAHAATGTLSDGLLTDVRRMPGVARAAGDARGARRGQWPRRQPLSPADRRHAPVRAPSAARFDRGFSYGFLAGVRALALPNPLVDSLGGVLGQPVTLRPQRRAGSMHGWARSCSARTSAALVDSPVAIAPLRYAQELTGQPGRISRIFVVPAAGRGRRGRGGPAPPRRRPR